MATALPRPNKIKLEGNPLSAYNVCLAFEEHAKDDKTIIRARLLGYLIIYAPTPNAQQEIAKEIHSCHHDFATLSNLAEHFVNYYVRPCKFSTQSSRVETS